MEFRSSMSTGDILSYIKWYSSHRNYGESCLIWQDMAYVSAALYDSFLQVLSFTFSSNIISFKLLYLDSYGWDEHIPIFQPTVIPSGFSYISYFLSLSINDFLSSSPNFIHSCEDFSTLYSFTHYKSTYSFTHFTLYILKRF